MELKINKKSKLKIKRILKKISIKKLVASLLIVGLAIADFFAMSELFTMLDASVEEVRVYSLTFAACLEGIPTFLGSCFSKLKDRTNYKKNELTNAKWGTGIGLAGIILAFILVVALRVITMVSLGGIKAFLAGKYAQKMVLVYAPNVNYTFLKDLFLTVSPVLTSILAFLTSWVVFPSDIHSSLEKELDEMQEDYIEKQSKFNTSYDKLDVVRMTIWKDIANSNTDMPRSINVFRKECYARIRNLITRDCVEKFPIQIEQYNASIKAELSGYLEDMEKYAVDGMSFSDIKIDDVIKKRDNKILKDEKRDASDCWDYGLAKPVLINQLKRLLNNAVVVAQYKSTGEQHFKEGDRW